MHADLNHRIRRTMVLMILDGWGHREEMAHNAIALANKPTWNYLWNQYPHALINTSGLAVGLPTEQMGNSEVGHMNIGAGRVIYQELTRIDRAIESREFEQHPILHQTFLDAAAHQRTVHVCGLFSPGGVHSHENHFFALFKLAEQFPQVSIVIHAFLDGRDCPPQSAEQSLQRLNLLLQSYPHIRLGSMIGRYYAMDRDQRWDRTAKAYDMLVHGYGFQAENGLAGLQAAYARGETDEFINPTLIYGVNEQPACIQKGDSIIFMNFRSDRMRQLVRSFIEEEFNSFERDRKIPLSHLVSMTQYANNIATEVLFPPQSIANTLGEYLAHLGCRQLRLAETEKYAHVTFFFNGGREEVYPNEERILVASPSVATYDLQPEMSVMKVTDHLVEAILSQKYDLIVCNYANADMVGHTGHLTAAVLAIEAIDIALQRVLAALVQTGSELLITADHGNAELMYDEVSQQTHTAHTHCLVPALYVGRPAMVKKETGILADIAPTILNLMDIQVPNEMTGESLFSLK